MKAAMHAQTTRVGADPSTKSAANEHRTSMGLHPRLSAAVVEWQLCLAAVRDV